MSGFSNPIVGGGGALVYPAIHSPNFVHGATGWSLNKDGSAEFHSVSLPTGAGGNVITLAAGAPSGPGITAGDLWFNLGNGTVSVWTGSAWSNFAYGTNAIGAGAVTLAKLAAGIVYAGIVDATTINAATFTGSVFQGTDFIINTTGAFFYAGTPAAGNLAASVVPGTTTVTDPHGNVAMAGLTAYQTPIALNSIATNVTAGVVQWAAWNGIGWGLGAGVDWTVPNGFLEVVNAPFRSLGGTRSAPTVISTDGWTTFGAFAAGFGAGGIAPQQCLMPAGPGGKGRVALRGQVLSTAATAANSTMVTAIGGPTQAMAWVVPTNANGYAPAAGSLPRVVLVDTAGNVRLQPSTSAANQFVLLDGIEWALG